MMTPPGWTSYTGGVYSIELPHSTASSVKRAAKALKSGMTLLEFIKVCRLPRFPKAWVAQRSDITP